MQNAIDVIKDSEWLKQHDAELIDKCLNLVREHLYNLGIFEIPDGIWNLGVDNTCEKIKQEMQKGNS